MAARAGILYFIIKGTFPKLNDLLIPYSPILKLFFAGGDGGDVDELISAIGQRRTKVDARGMFCLPFPR